MSVIAISVDVELATMNCGECGGTYAINERYRRQKYEKGGYWSCPYCRCSWGYSKEDSELERLKKQAEQEKKRREWAEQDAKRAKEQANTAENRRRAQKAASTRLKNRAKEGMCACCGQYFRKLHEHMRAQHPNFDPNADD